MKSDDAQRAEALGSAHGRTGGDALAPGRERQQMPAEWAMGTNRSEESKCHPREGTCWGRRCGQAPREQAKKVNALSQPVGSRCSSSRVTPQSPEQRETASTSKRREKEGKKLMVVWSLLWAG